MVKFIKITALLAIVVTCLIFVAYKIVTSDIAFGGNPLKQRASLFDKANNFHSGHFHNTTKARDINLWVTFKEYWHSEDRYAPSFPIEKPAYTEPSEPGLRAVWFGHASVLVEIDGIRVFFDPMLSEYAFPVESLAPQRLNPPPLSLEELPVIDAIVISHDHFDHLDMKTVQHLATQGAVIFVGYGVGAHLEKWGIPLDNIREMQWGDAIELNGFTFNCTEARHYSGRKSMSSDTLWTSWVVQGPKHSVFHSGDSGYSPHFKAIGEKFKNIDLSLIKVGDYGIDLSWQDIHMIPENSVQAHMDVGAKWMLPIHWGVFALSYHPWDEPIERAIVSANDKNINLVTPKIGEVFVYGSTRQNDYWWRSLSKQH